MISRGRYGYHLQDIAELEAKSGQLSNVEKVNLARMKAEVAEYEAKNGSVKDST